MPHKVLDKPLRRLERALRVLKNLREKLLCALQSSRQVASRLEMGALPPLRPKYSRQTVWRLKVGASRLQNSRQAASRLPVTVVPP